MNTYQCPHCPYQKDSWSVRRHMSRKHMTNQAGTGALERERVTSAHMQGASAHQQNLAIQDKIENLRQLQVAYQNVLTRNKQLEAEIAQLEACRNEELQKVSILEPELQKLSQINKQWSEAYRQLQVHLQNQV